jgi:hypothetical protein
LRKKINIASTVMGDTVQDWIWNTPFT